MIPERKSTRSFTLEDRPTYGLRKAIETVKEAVSIEPVAAEYGEFKRLGNGRLLGRCVAPAHEDKTPSMTLFTDTQRFKCFGCGLSGDVIDLEEIGGGHIEKWSAIIALFTRYGVTVPERPARWHEWQDEKGKRRDAIRVNLAHSYQRRYFRAFYSEYINEIEPELRTAEADRLWRGLERMALLCANRRMNRD